MKIYKVTDPMGKLIMIAPLPVIATIFAAASEATTRAESECEKGGSCEWFFNKRDFSKLLSTLLFLGMKIDKVVITNYTESK